jgi:hypothetical protein
MRILYLSCHSILEYDEIKLLRELGHYVFSPGAYVEPRNVGDATLRPGIDMDYDAEDLRLWHQIPITPERDQKSNIPRSFVERFDAVIVMHMPSWIYGNWDALSARPVVWRTIGQSIDAREAELRAFRGVGMKIVRYSPMEDTIPGYLGADAMIRFYKDPEEFKDWNGNKPNVLTFNQSISLRGPACNYDMWERVTGPFDRHIYGPANDGIRGWQGKVSFAELQQAMRDYRVYFYVGTHPASYTLNFIEAWMTGIPVVAIGPEKGNPWYFPGHHLYEIPNLITNGVDGFWSDSEAELQDYLRLVLEDDGVARSLSEAGRQSAIKHFNKTDIKAQWGQFLSTL